MEQGNSKRWCILRTSGGRTLALAKSLEGAGYSAWTPTESRARLAGAKRELVEQEIAILPGYVFAGMEHVSDLLSLARSPSLTYQTWDAEKRRMVVKGHPHFSVFLMHGFVRAQSEHSLAPLRALELELSQAAERRREREREKGLPPLFKAGELVRAQRGGFEGLDLLVAEDNVGKMVKVVRDDWVWTVEVSAWKLERVPVETQSAALAA